MNHLMLNFSTLLIISACATFISLRLNRGFRWVAVPGLIVLSLIIPVEGGNAWLWISGAVGELSVLTILLLTGFILRSLPGWRLFDARTRGHLYLLVLITGFLLYPATLGLSQFDPYTLGYGFELSLLLLSLSILYWVFNQQQVAIVLVFVVAAGETGILTSHNSWDYLIDPLLWLFTPVLLIIMVISSQRPKKVPA